MKNCVVLPAVYKNCKSILFASLISMFIGVLPVKAATIGAYETNELQIVITPDGFPIIWMKAQNYGVDFITVIDSSAPSGTNGVYHCYTNMNWNGSCHADSQADGAFYYKDFVTSGQDVVTAYFDASSNVVGTKLKSAFVLHRGAFDTVVDNATYTDAANDIEVVGTISGTFEVSQSGAAQYTIPIVVPPGIAGMKPDLSLVYSSQSGNGALGVGWSLTGLSEISRCTETLATDGYFEELRFNDSTYCLDGQRLLPSIVQGEYRTEVESFNRVTYAGNILNPSSFTVKTKSGLTYTYVPVLNSTETRTWKVSTINDTVNASNHISFVYGQDTATGEHYIDQIRYANNGSYLAYVDFEYDFDRGDAFHGWSMGQKTAITARLKHIRTYADGKLARDYRLKYRQDAVSGSSMIDAIKLCSGPNAAGQNECYRESRFNWDFASTDLGQRYATPYCADGNCNWTRDNGSFFYPDLNGDSHSDLCYLGDDGLICHVNNMNNGFGAAQETGACDPVPLYGWTPTDCKSYTTDMVTDVSYFFEGSKTAQFADIDGDGKDDFVFRAVDGIRVLFSARNGSGWLEPYVATNVFSPVVSGTHHAKSDRFDQLYFPDVDGNGVVDLCYKHERGMACHKATGVRSAPWEETPYWSKGVCAYGGDGWGWCDQDDNFPTIRFVDINGDRMDDLVYRGDHGMRAWFSTGNDFVYNDDAFDVHQPSWVYGNPGTYKSLCANDGGGYVLIWYPPGGESTCNQNHFNTIQFADINGDGLLDICYRAAQGIHCWKNQGIADSGSPGGELRWGDPVITSICADHSTAYGICRTASHFRSIRFVDVNGDGKADLTYRGDEGMQIHLSTGSGFKHHKSYNICAAGSSLHGICDSDDNYNHIGMADFNGDGHPDLAYRANAGIQTWINNGYKTNLLTSFNNGLGESVDISYSRLSRGQVYAAAANPSNVLQAGYRYIQPPMSVVASFERDNGIGGKNTMAYFYSALRVNLRGRGLQGFYELESLSDKGIRQYNSYSQDFPTTGMPLKSASYVEATQTTGGGKQISFQDNSPLAVATSEFGRTFPYIQHSHEYSRDLQTPDTVWDKNVYTETKYDGYGNVDWTRTESMGLDGLVYTTFTDNDYGTVESDRINGRLKSAVVTHTEPDTTAQVRKSEFTYYSNGLLKEEKIVRPETPSSIYPIKEQTTFYQYDVDLDGYGFGNQRKKTVSGAGVTSRVTETNYDSSHRFPEYIINNLGHKEYREYDARIGKVTLQVGPYEDDVNSPITFADAVRKGFKFDGFGREIENRTSVPDGSYTDLVTTTSYSYCVITCPIVDAFYMVTTETAGITGESVTYYDMLGREVLKQTTGFSGNKVYVQTRYDEFGRTHKVSRPDSNAANPAHWTTMAYDDLDRVIAVTVPYKEGDSYLDAITQTVYNGLETTVTNAKGQQKIERRDILGRLTQVEDANNNTMEFDYTYVDNVQVKTTTDALLNEIVVKLDARDQKVWMSDPDMGVWTYDYNAFGELVSQRDARGVVTAIEYDTLGRMKSRTDNAVGSDPGTGFTAATTTWVYDTEYPGKLTSVNGNVPKTYKYDSMGRGREVTTTVSADVYVSRKTYDDLGRPSRLTYPNGFEVRNEYNDYGYHNKVVQVANPAMVYWQANHADEEGNITHFEYGNDIIAMRDYVLGRLEWVNSGLGGLNYQDDWYTYDEIGNLTSRQILSPHNSLVSYSETFDYDKLNRLTVVNGAQNDPNVYDEIGNLLTRVNVPRGSPVTSINYEYTDTSHPKRLTAITGAANRSFTYDDNGNMLTSGSRTMTWSPFNKITSIADGSAWETYVYDADRNRTRRFNSSDGMVDYLLPKANLGIHYEREADFSGLNVTHKNYIYAMGQIVAIESSGVKTKTEYLLFDHLGSIVLVTDENGQLADSRSFDAFGQSRTIDWTEVYPYPSVIAMAQSFKANTRRGYTGHEQIPDFNLINMNGRVYDPEIGRFLSPDPVVQFADNMQSYNRYAYVLNNPLAFTDPSGHLSLRSIVAGLVGIGVAFIVGPWATIASANLFAGSVVAGIAGGFAAGVVSGAGLQGSMNAAFMGGVTAGAFGFAGHVSGALGFAKGSLGSIGLHGLAGGLSHEMRGGRFKDGFLSAGVTELFSPALSRRYAGSRIKQVTAAAVVGGTASKIGGGKFANGGITSAFSTSLGIFVSSTRKPQPYERGARKVAYVGGFFDKAVGGPVITAYRAASENAAYFQWWERGAFAEWIDANGGDVDVVAHSYGADMAAEIIASGHAVRVLVTVDPVGWVRPDFLDVAANAEIWVNVYAAGGGEAWNNFVADIGGQWGNEPSNFATAHIIDVNKGHYGACTKYCGP